MMELLRGKGGERDRERERERERKEWYACVSKIEDK